MGWKSAFLQKQKNIKVYSTKTVWSKLPNTFHTKLSENLKIEINQLISDQIGPIAKLDKIQFVSGLPKTRSGKIMRRILRKIAEGDFSNFGDTTTLLNPEIVDEIKD